jgi:hypothetical protein
MEFPRWRFFCLVLIITVVFMGYPGRAQAGHSTPEAAAQAALDDYNARRGVDYSIVLADQVGDIAYATAANGESHFVMLASQGAQGWTALIPGESPAADYNAVLDRFPESMIDTQTKEMLRQPEAQAADIGPGGAGADLALANFSGHKLPWTYGIDGYVTQKDTPWHMNQIDFDIQGLANSGDVIASKPGTVVFAKESSNTTCQNPSPDPCWKKSNMVVIRHSSSEYSWYVHLAYNSVTVSVGQNVSYGTKIGVEGETGYSFGVHLHYMASNSAPSTWPDPNDPNALTWPSTANMIPVDFDEYSWANLVQTYSRTYRSQNSANIPPVCPGAGGVLLYRDSSNDCDGQAQNAGFVFNNSIGVQEMPSGMNNAASSIRIPDGWSVMLYENGTEGGGQKCINAPGSANFSGQTFSNGVSLNDTVSSYRVFNELNCPSLANADLTAPQGSLSAPANGATVGRSIDLSASASDDQSGVQAVRFSAAWGGGQPRVIFTDTSAPYNYTWDFCAAGVPDGTVEFSAQIIDQAWNTYSPPAVQVTKAFDCSTATGGAATIACTDDQWCGSFWNNVDLNGAPLAQRNEGEVLAHEWGSASPDPLLPAGPFSSRFARSAQFDCGRYRFTATTTDGVKVWVDDVLKIDQWAEQAQSANHPFEIDLSRGSHTLKVEQFHSTGTASLALNWEKISDCASSAAVESASTHYVLPGTTIEPAIRVRMNSGYLDPARGDVLVFSGSGSQTTLSAETPQRVRSLTETGSTYTFAPANGLRMTAPSTDGVYNSPWQVRYGGGAAISESAAIQVIVDSRSPSISLSAPSGNLTGSSISIQVSASDTTSGVSHVQFFARYRATAGGSLEWHDLGYDLWNGDNTWSKTWDASAVPDQSGVQFFAQAWDRSGNGNGVWTSGMVLDRTPPSAAVSPLAGTQDSTRFQVSWSASDNLSGVNRVDLQYQENGGAWQSWLTGQAGSSGSAWFTGQLGNDYAFRARAVDQVGNSGSFSGSGVSTHVNTCSGDSAEPDNNYTSAGNLAPGGAAVTHNLCGTGDQDWYAFSAEAGKNYMFFSNASGASTDTVLALYRLDGSTLTLLRQDDRANTRNSAFTWQMGDQSQTLYLMVRHAESQVAGSGVTYSLQGFEALKTHLPIIGRQ